MGWQVVSRYAELRGAPVIMPPARAYALLDGLFEQALLRHLAGIEHDLRAGALQVLGLIASPCV